MDHEYIARKIHMCIELVNNAISPEQKKIYQEYLEFWQKKHKNIIIHPIKPQNDEIYDDQDYEAIFNIEFPNKKAYYKRNGVIYQTKAYREFLISKQ